MLQIPALDILDIAGYCDGLMVWNFSKPRDRTIKIFRTIKNFYASKTMGLNQRDKHSRRNYNSMIQTEKVVRKLEAGVWLHSTNESNCQTKISLIFICAARVNRIGPQGLSCLNSAGLLARHAYLNIKIKLASADVREVKTIREPTDKKKVSNFGCFLHRDFGSEQQQKIENRNRHESASPSEELTWL